MISIVPWWGSLLVCKKEHAYASELGFSSFIICQRLFSTLSPSMIYILRTSKNKIFRYSLLICYALRCSYSLWSVEDKSFMLAHLDQNLASSLIILRSLNVYSFFNNESYFWIWPSVFGTTCRQLKEYRRSDQDITLQHGCLKSLLQQKKLA